MKTKNIVTVVLVAFTLVSCAPIETTIPLTIATLTLPALAVSAEPTVTFIPIQNVATSTESITPVSLCGESVSVSPTLRKLTVEDLRVILEYPADWKCDDTGNQGFNYYSGTDGFFHILSTPIRHAKDFCEAQIRQSVGKGRDLYGANPTMKLLQVDNQPACLVLPSDDQPKYRLSMLVVEYPDPDEKYGPLLVLDADINHIYDFIGTLKFIRQKP